MLVYWLLFGYFAVGALLGHDPLPGQRRGRLLFLLGSSLIALAIGFRYEVGADWETYEFWFKFAGFTSFDRMLEFKDPGYQLLNWTVQNIGGEIWLVNLICGSIFAWGLYRFVMAQPEPWLAFVVAVPYFVVVVAMGYSRQAVAIGLLMAGLASVGRGASALKFTLWVVAAALFHRTAVVALPLVAMVGQRSQIINLAVVITAGILFYDMLLEDSMESFVRNYIDAQYSSQGALIRVALDVLPALFFFRYQKRLGFSETERQLWRNFSITAFVLLALLFVSPSTTAVDRIALYILPLQVAVFCRLPNGLGISKTFGKLLVVIGAFLIQFVWLNWATHAEYWLPYQFFPF